ncbi:MAG: hypothetical protein HQL12_05460 [Candidatus Omnitrophica bacterium]|nr:hypothetical protein [Candidatus Omnitrophota bacterium]
MRAPCVHIIILTAFLANTFGPVPMARAQDFRLPAPGVMVHLSPPLDPPILKGIKVHPDDPFRFDFILDKGDMPTRGHVQNRKTKNVSPSTLPSESGLNVKASQGENPTQNEQELRIESTKLIKYFLASLTIPEKDLWVNLSPYEKDRIIPNSFGLTEMGRDLLAEDYMLKQITASLIYPEDETGRKFWKRIYEEAFKKYGTTDIPVNTFNKVWIVPQKAVVYENAKAGTAYVVESKLKVMLEQDYLSFEKHQMPTRGHVPAFGDVFPSTLPSKSRAEGESAPGQSPSALPYQETNALGSQIVREIVIPELTKEVNENKNFAKLRQIYNSLILATWYKNKIKESILSQVYANKNKVAGVSVDDPQEKERIYQKYLRAFKTGVFNYIKEGVASTTQETMPRKYFSGGVNLAFEGTNFREAAMTAANPAQVSAAINKITEFNRAMKVIVDISQSNQGSPAINSTTMSGVTVQGETRTAKTWPASKDGKRYYLYVNEKGRVWQRLINGWIAGQTGVNFPKVFRVEGEDYLNNPDIAKYWRNRRGETAAYLAADINDMTVADLNDSGSSGLEAGLVYLQFSGDHDIDFNVGSPYNVIVLNLGGKKRYIYYDFEFSYYDSSSSSQKFMLHGSNAFKKYWVRKINDLSAQRVVDALRKIYAITTDSLSLAAGLWGVPANQIDFVKFEKRKKQSVEEIIQGLKGLQQSQRVKVLLNAIEDAGFLNNPDQALPRSFGPNTGKVLGTKRIDAAMMSDSSFANGHSLAYDSAGKILVVKRLQERKTDIFEPINKGGENSDIFDLGDSVVRVLKDKSLEYSPKQLEIISLLGQRGASPRLLSNPGRTKEGNFYLHLEKVQGENVEELIGRKGKLDDVEIEAVKRLVDILIEENIVDDDFYINNIMLGRTHPGAPLGAFLVDFDYLERVRFRAEAIDSYIVDFETMWKKADPDGHIVKYLKKRLSAQLLQGNSVQFGLQNQEMIHSEDLDFNPDTTTLVIKGKRGKARFLKLISEGINSWIYDFDDYSTIRVMKTKDFEKTYPIGIIRTLGEKGVVPKVLSGQGVTKNGYYYFHFQKLKGVDVNSIVQEKGALNSGQINAVAKLLDILIKNGIFVHEFKNISKVMLKRVNKDLWSAYLVNTDMFEDVNEEIIRDKSYLIRRYFQVLSLGGWYRADRKRSLFDHLYQKLPDNQKLNDATEKKENGPSLTENHQSDQSMMAEVNRQTEYKGRFMYDNKRFNLGSDYKNRDVILKPIDEDWQKGWGVYTGDKLIAVYKNDKFIVLEIKRRTENKGRFVFNKKRFNLGIDNKNKDVIIKPIDEDWQKGWGVYIDKHLIADYRTVDDSFILYFGEIEKDLNDPALRGLGEENGGIDFSPVNMNLQTKVEDSRFRGNDNVKGGDVNGGIKFYLDPAVLQQLQNAPGFVPVIINIQPIINLRQFLGIKENALVKGNV